MVKQLMPNPIVERLVQAWEPTVALSWAPIPVQVSGDSQGGPLLGYAAQGQRDPDYRLSARPGLLDASSREIRGSVILSRCVYEMAVRELFPSLYVAKVAAEHWLLRVIQGRCVPTEVRVFDLSRGAWREWKPPGRSWRSFFKRWRREL